MSDDPRLFQGGKADGNKSDGEEPRKKRRTIPAISLDGVESETANIIEKIVRFAARLSLITDDAETRERFNVSVNPEQGTIASYATPTDADFVGNGIDSYRETYADIPGVTVEEAPSEKWGTDVRITLDPRILSDYLHSDEVKALLDKIHTHYKSLPVDDSGKHHKDKLAGISENTRSILARAKNDVKLLEKEVVMARVLPASEHPNIAQHKSGGMDV